MLPIAPPDADAAIGVSVGTPKAVPTPPIIAFLILSNISIFNIAVAKSATKLLNMSFITSFKFLVPSISPTIEFSIVENALFTAP